MTSNVNLTSDPYYLTFSFESEEYGECTAEVEFIGFTINDLTVAQEDTGYEVDNSIVTSEQVWRELYLRYALLDGEQRMTREEFEKMYVGVWDVIED